MTTFKIGDKVRYIGYIDSLDYLKIDKVYIIRKIMILQKKYYIYLNDSPLGKFVAFFSEDFKKVYSLKDRLDLVKELLKWQTLK